MTPKSGIRFSEETWRQHDVGGAWRVNLYASCSMGDDAIDESRWSKVGVAPPGGGRYPRPDRSRSATVFIRFQTSGRGRPKAGTK